MKKHIKKMFAVTVICAVLLSVFLIPASAASAYTDAIKNVTATPYTDYDYKSTLSQSGNIFSGISSGDGFVRTKEPVPLPDYAIYHLTFSCNARFNVSIRGNGKQIMLIQSSGNNITFADGIPLEKWNKDDYLLGDIVDLYYYHDLKNDTFTVWLAESNVEGADSETLFLGETFTARLSDYQIDYATDKEPFPLYIYLNEVTTSTYVMLSTFEVFSFAHTMNADDLYYFMKTHNFDISSGIFNQDKYEYYHEVYESGYNSGVNDGYSIGWSGAIDELQPEWEQEANDAYDRGYGQGYATGNTDGKKEGYATGKTEGKNEGYAAGKVDGKNEGYKEAYDKYLEQFNEQYDTALSQIDKNEGTLTQGFLAGMWNGTQNFLQTILNGVTFSGLSLMAIVSTLIAILIAAFVIKMIRG